MYELTEHWTGDLYCVIKLNWDYNARTLDILMPGYIKNTPKILTSRPPQATTFFLFPLPNTVWGKGTDSHSSQHFPKIITQRHQGDTTNYRQHIILCAGGQHHHPHGLKLHRNQTNKGDNKYDGKGQTTPQSSCHKSRCHHPVPCVRHDH